MKTTIGRWMWPVVLAVVLAACGSNGSADDPECESDAECDSGTCVDGTCQKDDDNT